MTDEKKSVAVKLKTVLINYKWYFIVAIVVIVLSAGNFVGGCFYGEHKVTKAVSGQKQEIPKKGKGKKGDIPPIPKDCDGYKKCAQSEIFTKFTLENNFATIRAWNTCKFKEDKYPVPVLYYKHTIEFNPGVGVGGYDGKILPIFGGSLLYVHRFGPSFGFGGGPFYFTSIDRKMWNAGVQLSLQYSW
jgi:hypothetical protein